MKTFNTLGGLNRSVKGALKKAGHKPAYWMKGRIAGSYSSGFRTESQEWNNTVEVWVKNSIDYKATLEEVLDVLQSGGYEASLQERCVVVKGVQE